VRSGDDPRHPNYLLIPETYDVIVKISINNENDEKYKEGQHNKIKRGHRRV